jgi:hypothetical protein
MLIVQSSKHQIWWGLWVSFLAPYNLVPGDRHLVSTWCLHSKCVSPDLIHLQEHTHSVTSTTARIRATNTQKNHELLNGYNDISWSVKTPCVM